MNATALSILGTLLSSASLGIPDCPNISDYRIAGTILYPEIDEGSGLVWSQTDKYGMFWTLNDSGGGTATFAVDSKGVYIGKIILMGAQNMDFEAISTAPCDDTPNSGYCLFLGDIGDNSHEYDNRIIYKVKEPTRAELFHSQNFTILSEDWTKVVYEYEGKGENSEGFIIDPVTREVLIITKTFFDTKVFVGELDARDDKPVKLRDLGVNLPMVLTTDAAYSHGYYSMGIRTYSHIFLYRNDGQKRPFKDILKKDTPCKISIVPTEQVMGESLALANDGTVYIHSEYIGKKLYAYDTTKTV